MDIEFSNLSINTLYLNYATPLETKQLERNRVQPVRDKSSANVRDLIPRGESDNIQKNRGFRIRGRN